MEPVKSAEPRAPGSGEWEELRGRVRHRVAEALDLITILLQDAVILLAGFFAEFAYEKWLHSEQPFFQFAISVSSAVFLLLYVVTVTVHVVQYVRGQGRKTLPIMPDCPMERRRVRFDTRGFGAPGSSWRRGAAPGVW